MKNLIIMLITLVFTTCPNSNNSRLNNSPVNDNITFIKWKKSVQSISKLTDFQRENLKTIINEISDKDFLRLVKLSPNTTNKCDCFFILSYSEGEITTSILRFYKLYKNRFYKSSLTLEYGEKTFSKMTKNQSLTIPSLNNSSSEVKYKSSGFVIASKINENKELTSFLLNNLPNIYR